MNRKPKSSHLRGSAGLSGEVGSLICISSISVVAVLMESSTESLHFEHHSKKMFLVAAFAAFISLLDM